MIEIARTVALAAAWLGAAGMLAGALRALVDDVADRRGPSLEWFLSGLTSFVFGLVVVAILSGR